MMATQFKKTCTDHPSEQVFCFHTHSNKSAKQNHDAGAWLKKILPGSPLSFSLQIVRKNRQKKR